MLIHVSFSMKMEKRVLRDRQIAKSQRHKNWIETRRNGEMEYLQNEYDQRMTNLQTWRNEIQHHAEEERIIRQSYRTTQIQQQQIMNELYNIIQSPVMEEGKKKKQEDYKMAVTHYIEQVSIGWMGGM